MVLQENTKKQKVVGGFLLQAQWVLSSCFFHIPPYLKVGMCFQSSITRIKNTFPSPSPYKSPFLCVRGVYEIFSLTSFAQSKTKQRSTLSQILKSLAGVGAARWRDHSVLQQVNNHYFSVCAECVQYFHLLFFHRASPCQGAHARQTFMTSAIIGAA